MPLGILFRVNDGRCSNIFSVTPPMQVYPNVSLFTIGERGNKLALTYLHAHVLINYAAPAPPTLPWRQRDWVFGWMSTCARTGCRFMESGKFHKIDDKHEWFTNKLFTIIFLKSIYYWASIFMRRIIESGIMHYVSVNFMESESPRWRFLNESG